MTRDKGPVGIRFENIFLLSDRNDFHAVARQYDPVTDLVLTFDYGLKNAVCKQGGRAEYVDHLCAKDEMQENNYRAAEFFRRWHLDLEGNDIFTAFGIDFGFALRIEFWSEYLNYVRLRASLNKLAGFEYKQLFVICSEPFFPEILDEAGIEHSWLENKTAKTKDILPRYFFDIYRYMQDALHGTSLSAKFKKIYLGLLAKAVFFLDTKFGLLNNKHIVYAQLYHPTYKLVAELSRDPRIKVVTASPFRTGKIRDFFLQRLVPGSVAFNGRSDMAKKIMQLHAEKKCARLQLADGLDLTEDAYRIIKENVAPLLPDILQKLNAAKNYADSVPIRLQLMIANIGVEQTLMDCVLKAKKIPSYLIINGILSDQHNDEGKYASYINSYSTSIKEHYFRGMSNIVTLGDPRMDVYADSLPQRSINREKPVISIGTSGFNSIDLTSYQAIEFEFMSSVLTAINQVMGESVGYSVIIKVRPNGYHDQYKKYVEEYFPNMPIQVVQRMPIWKVLMKTDLYISIYSQTLFEASCLGIPVIYYKNDQEDQDPPFDNQSELVTACDPQELRNTLVAFLQHDSIFDAFLSREVLEKYIGPLDGENTRRNLEFIYALLEGNAENHDASIH